MDSFDELGFQGDTFDIVLPPPIATNIITPAAKQACVVPKRNNVVWVFKPTEK